MVNKQAQKCTCVIIKTGDFYRVSCFCYFRFMFWVNLSMLDTGLTKAKLKWQVVHYLSSLNMNQVENQCSFSLWLPALKKKKKIEKLLEVRLWQQVTTDWRVLVKCIKLYRWEQSVMTCWFNPFPFSIQSWLSLPHPDACYNYIVYLLLLVSYNILE